MVVVSLADWRFTWPNQIELPAVISLLPLIAAGAVDSIAPPPWWRDIVAPIKGQWAGSLIRIYLVVLPILALSLILLRRSQGCRRASPGEPRLGSIRKAIKAKSPTRLYKIALSPQSHRSLVFIVPAIAIIVLLLEQLWTLVPPFVWFILLLWPGIGLAEWLIGYFLRFVPVADQPQRLLFLRPFIEDKKARPFGLFSQRRKSVELPIVERLQEIGPIVAIGRPSETSVPAGARRKYPTADEWKNAVSSAIKEAPIIAMIAGTTNGVHWELAEIVRQNRLDRAIIFVGTGPASAGTAVWSCIEDCLAGTIWENSVRQAAAAPGAFKCLTFCNSGNVRLVTADIANSDTLAWATTVCVDWALAARRSG